MKISTVLAILFSAIILCVVVLYDAVTGDVSEWFSSLPETQHIRCECSKPDMRTASCASFAVNI